MEQKDFSKILIIYSDFYKEISKNLLLGSENFLKKMRVSYDKQRVDGSLEIPFLLSKFYRDYSGIIILGCVIKGETDHYNIVKDITLSKIYDFSYENNFPVSNALLTVENYSQALDRSKTNRKNLGQNAAKVCLELINKINEK